MRTVSTGPGPPSAMRKMSNTPRTASKPHEVARPWNQRKLCTKAMPHETPAGQNVELLLPPAFRLCAQVPERCRPAERRTSVICFAFAPSTCRIVVGSRRLLVTADQAFTFYSCRAWAKVQVLTTSRKERSRNREKEKQRTKTKMQSGNGAVEFLFTKTLANSTKTGPT